MLRFATTADAEALRAIYARYIDTAITFEYELPSPAEFRHRIEEISRDYPYLVHETDSGIDGYAYAHRHMERAAYQWNAELSVYLAPEVLGRGIGTALYVALIKILKRQGVRNVFGCVTLPNEKSERLHRSMGFALVGTYTMAGYKNGAWRNVGWFQKTIGEYDDDPAPFVSLLDLDPAEIGRLLL